jgi:hypothetical protein
MAAVKLRLLGIESRLRKREGTNPAKQVAREYHLSDNSARENAASERLRNN